MRQPMFCQGLKFSEYWKLLNLIVSLIDLGELYDHLNNYKILV